MRRNNSERENMPKLYPGYRDEIREKIVREAYQVFLKKGYDGTKMEDIAANLGVTKPAIYRYFRTKDELFFVSLAEHVMKEFQETIEISFESNNLSEAGDSFFDALLEANRKYATLGRDIKSVVSKNEALSESVMEYQRAIHKTLEYFFARQVELGCIHSHLGVKDLAHVCTALVNGLVEDVMTGMDPIEVKGIWHRAFAELLQIQKIHPD
jgi:AcrR family transcriptional regulator